MNVTTPISAPVVSASDTSPATGSGAAEGIDGEFSDALAGFLADSTAQGDADPSAGGGTDTPTPDTAAALAATAPALVPVALVPAAVALALNAPGISAPVAGSLAEEAVNGVTGTTPSTPAAASAVGAVGATGAVGAMGAGAVQLNAAASASSDASLTSTSPASVQPQTGQPTSQQPATSAAGAIAQPVQPSVGKAAGDTFPGADTDSDAGVDVAAAARALGLTLTSAAQSEASVSATTADADGQQVVPLASTDATPMVAGPAPATPTTTAAQTSAASLPAPAPAAPRPVHVAHQFATQLAALTGAGNGVHTMTIQITPDDLGPVQVQVTLTDGVVDMNVLTALEVGRDTITQAAPDLRRYLEAAGLTCNSVEVDLNNDQSSWLSQPDAEQNFGERQPTNGREQAGTPSGDIDEPTTAPVATRSPSSTSTGVDLQM